MISIVMPAYKKKFLAEAIESILNQSFRDFELIIVDDCSPENLYDVVSSYPDSRVSYFRNSENLGAKGMVKNWNYCLSLANREWFVLASDDDIYDSEYLQSMVNLIGVQLKVEVFRSRVSIIDSESRVIDVSSSCPVWESASDFLWHRIKGFRVCYIPEFLFKTDRLRKIGGFIDFPAAWGSDVATCALAGEENGIGGVNSPLVQWRRSGMNITASQKYVAEKLQGFDSYYNWCADFLQHQTSLYAQLSLKELRRFNLRSKASLVKLQRYHEIIFKLLTSFHSDLRWVHLRALILKVMRK